MNDDDEGGILSVDGGPEFAIAVRKSEYENLLEQKNRKKMQLMKSRGQVVNGTFGGSTGNDEGSDGNINTYGINQNNLFVDGESKKKNRFSLNDDDSGD